MKRTRLATSLSLAGVFMLILTTNMSADNYPVNEDLFLKSEINFSPESEASLDDRPLVPPKEPYPFPKSEIKNVDGVLRMTCDGEPLNFFCRDVWSTTLKGAPLERQLRERGVKFFQINTDIHAPLDEDPHHAFELFKRRADNLLNAVPDAKFMIRIWMMNVSDDFAEKHPDALLSGPTGKTDWGGRYYTNITSRPNALNEWRRYCGEALRQFIDDVGKSTYAKHVVGFYVGALNSGEWWYYKGKGDPGWDYSSTRKQAFLRFLEKKYEDLPDKTSADVYALPTLEERNQRPIKPCSKVADYLQVLNLPVTNAAKYFAKIIKRATSENSLAGMEIHAGLECFPSNGTVFLTQLMDSPDIDFLGGPSAYGGREPGNSPLHRNASASLKAHGMLWYNEGDYRTHNCYGTKSGKAGHPPLDPKSTVNVLRREFARAMMKHYPTYLMDFGWNWFYDRDVIEEIGDLDRLGEFMMGVGLERNAEIAVVADQESQLYANWFANPNHMRHHVLDHIGCDYDFYELRDFLEGDRYKDYKFIIFLNIRALSDPEREEMRKIKSDGRVVMWMHDPGLVNLSRRDADANRDLFELTGMKLENKVASEGNIVLVNENYQSAINESELPEHIFEGAANKLKRTELMREVSISDTATGLLVGNVTAPIECVDPEAIPLGKDQNGKCRFAIKKFDDWTSVYTASCLVLPEIIRDLAKLAGCQVYLDTDDICLANDNFVSVHASKTGDKTIRLPAKSDVRELFSGEVVATGVDHFTIPMKWGETRLFHLGDWKEAEKSLSALRNKRDEERRQFVAKHPPPSVPLANYNRARSLPPEEFFKLMKKWRKPPENPEGPYPLSAFTPDVFLVSGPYPASRETNEKIAEFAKKAGNDPTGVDWNAMTVDFEKDNPDRRRADAYLYLTKPKPNASLTEGFPSWRAVCQPKPWINDYDLDIGRNQTGMIAFFIEGGLDKEAEVVFSANGDAEIWVNGDALGEKNGMLGTIVPLSQKRNLFVIRLTNTGGDAGFTCKFIEPDQTLKPGKQARKQARGLSVWLKPRPKNHLAEEVDNEKN